jgi:hypothetical protein
MQLAYEVHARVCGTRMRHAYAACVCIPHTTHSTRYAYEECVIFLKNGGPKPPPGFFCGGDFNFGPHLKGNMPELRMRQNIPRHRLSSCSTCLVSDGSITGVVSACALVAKLSHAMHLHATHLHAALLHAACLCSHVLVLS